MVICRYISCESRCYDTRTSVNIMPSSVVFISLSPQSTHLGTLSLQDKADIRKVIDDLDLGEMHTLWLLGFRTQYSAVSRPSLRRKTTWSAKV